MRFRVGLLVALWALAVPVASAGWITLAGEIRDDSGTPVTGVLLRAESLGLEFETRTAEDGSFSFQVLDLEEPWTITADAGELIGLGYFCVPGFIWEPGEPVDIGELTAVPLRPDIIFERSESGVSCLRLNFDWVDGVTPNVLRQYRIERSTDGENWSEVMRVGLACPPIEFFDETVPGEKQCFYRAVAVDSVIIETLEPWEMEFLADPALGWEGDPVLNFVEGNELPASPILAPAIFLSPAG